ncbi:MAG: cupin domain-containing protein [Acidobacteria bacterium]|nr:cupin domain-containing protein [Acidobacteriota bacterium]
MVIHDIASFAVFRPDKMGKADLVTTSRLFVGINSFEPGQEHASHVHEGQDKVYLILEGRGHVILGDLVRPVGPGDLVLAQADEPHGLRNPGPERLVAAVFMAPPPAAKKAG